MEDYSKYDFVGIGWAFPPGVNANGGIAMVAREQEIEQAIQIIVMTYPGERPMRPQFGCRLRDYAFRSADNSTAVELSLAVKNAVTQWEPRVDVIDVVARPNRSASNRLDVEIIYEIKRTNDRRNLVFPYYTIPDER